MKKLSQRREMFAFAVSQLVAWQLRCEPFWREGIMDEKKTAASPSAETMIERAVEESVSRAVFSSGIQRREFMRLLGGAGALAALDSVFPLDAAKALAQEKPGPIEKKELK